MEALKATEACFEEDFLDFALEGELMGDDDVSKDDSYTSFESKTTSLSHEMNTSSFSELIVEEELEWLSNKDAFPSVETCFGILSENPQLISGRNSPISVLENSSISTSHSCSIITTKDDNISNSTLNPIITSCFSGLKVPTNFPVRPRSNMRRRARKIVQPSLIVQANVAFKKSREMTNMPSSRPRAMANNTGRRCLHCQVDKTPQWRAGPMGPKTLCNACGVRYKSGRLLPEYRPANSPTFSSALHSNSHRKVVEMRKNKENGR